MIELENVQFNYGTKEVLSKCSLTIPEGEMTAITGNNGSGKTTLSLLIAGILTPCKGMVTVDGTAGGGNNEGLRGRIGIVFENPDNQFITTSVERELAFGLENLGVEPKRIRERVGDCLERFCLKEIRKRAPHTLSGGEKQKVAIAAAFIAYPRYLILDEPTTFLDPLSREMVRSMICALREKVTIICVSQFPSEILIADRIYELDGGQVKGPVDREQIFSTFSTVDPTIGFLHKLKVRGAFDGNTIPPVEQLCSHIEELKKRD